MPGRTLWVGSLSGGQPKSLGVRSDSAARYAAGHLLFVRDNTLLAQPFDLRSLTAARDPIPVIKDVPANLINGRPSFAVGGSHLLIYSTGAGPGRALTWLDRSGSRIAAFPDRGLYVGFDIFPDGRRVAAHLHIGGPSEGGDVWILDPDRGSTQFTFDPRHDEAPKVSPDGLAIWWTSNRTGGNALYRRPADGAGREDTFAMPTADTVLEQVTRHWILETSAWNGENPDIWYAPVADPARTQPYMASKFQELRGQLSPDERWIAYQSNENSTGHSQIYVASFPDWKAGRWAVPDSDTGMLPRWSGDGTELFFVLGGGLANGIGPRVMAASVARNGNALAIGRAKELFQTQFFPPGGFAVSHDGRFLVGIGAAANPTEPVGSLKAVVNWTGLLGKGAAPR
jgi:Tol biopolymer transport system component